MRWDTPWLLLALLIVPVLVWLRVRRRAHGAAVLWVRSQVAGGGGGAIVRAVALLPWAALILALLALARPQQGLSQSETETRGVDIVLGIDISPSMQAQDFLPKNRLSVAKEAARDFIRGRPHDRIGLVGFAATAFTQCPLTLDHDALIELLQGLDFGLAEDGTAIGMGVATAVARLRESKTPSKVIVLLTDGANNRGQIDPMTSAALARAYGIKVYTVLVGREGPVPVPIPDPDNPGIVHIRMMPMDIDPPTLQAIARQTGGRYFRATDPAALSQIYGEIDRLERAPIRSVEYKDYRDVGPLLLGVAAALLAAHALASTTFAFRLP
jgi:Ca-activated chloride channel homolog